MRPKAPQHPPRHAPASPPTWEVVVLAGGLGSRLGRDKARVRLGGKTLLTMVLEAAAMLGGSSRVIRKDHVARCGPLGGIYTALKTSQAQFVAFLAVDMPFVSARCIRRVAKRSSQEACAVFTAVEGVVGFPFALRRDDVPLVEAQIRRGDYSLQALARAVGAVLVEAGSFRKELENINTPEELAAARRRYSSRSASPKRISPKRRL